MKLLLIASVVVSAAVYAGISHVGSAERQTFKAGECRAVDGDTLNCQGLRVRLNGIDAPEMPGHCRKGRVCVAGNPYDSRASLASLTTAVTTILPLKIDRYGRTVAEVKLGSIGWEDASCAQIRRGQAIYKPRWDERRTTAAACPEYAR
jgi:micrococcal nuclease